MMTATATTTTLTSTRRPDASAVTKHSLAFILDHRQLHDQHDCHHQLQQQHSESPTRHWCLAASPRLGSSVSQLLQTLASQRLAPKRPREEPADARPRPRKRAQSAEEKRLARQCTVDGCANYTIDRGLCFRHGGGKTCSQDGCERSAKARGLCWRHGGSIRCSVADCPRGAKSRGLCWSHGGGRRCARSDCGQVVTKRRATLCDHHQLGRIHASQAVLLG